MRSFARALTVISALGLILSTGAAVNAFARYLTLSHRTSTLEALAPNQDDLAPKISSLLAEHPNKEMVVGELRTRHELSATLHSTLATIIADSKDNAKADTALWIGAAVLFFLVLLRSEELRRGEKIATGP
jgi:hypothetical protein